MKAKLKKEKIAKKAYKKWLRLRKDDKYISKVSEVRVRLFISTIT